MAWANPPAFIDQLRTQLNACAAWTTAGGVLANIHYPLGDAADTSYPAAVLAEENVSYAKLFHGLAPIPSGELTINLYTQTSIGETEILARAIGSQIVTDDGLANLAVLSVEPSTDTSAAEEATNGGTDTFLVTITLSFGLEV